LEEPVNVNQTADMNAKDHRIVGMARASVREQLEARGLSDLTDEAQLVVSELVTNAILHGGGCTDVTVLPIDGGIRIEIADGRPLPPVLGFTSDEAMTGRGLRLVGSMAARWGAEPRGTGKIVWAEVTAVAPAAGTMSEPDLLALWDEDSDEGLSSLFHVVLGDVPTDLLLAAKSHVDNLVREFTLVASGARAGTTSEVVPHLGALIDAVAHRFARPRDSIKRQALAAAAAGKTHTRLHLELDAESAVAARDYLDALDAVDAYCRAGRLLTLETPPRHRVFRHWYVEELIDQVTALAAGRTPPPPQTFLERLLQEIERVAAAQEIAERSARLYTVAVALAGAASPEEVAAAVLDEGVAALGASGGGLLLPDADRIMVPGTVGYDEDVIARLRAERRDADLPAAVSLRTSQAVWIESRSERDRRFPQLVDLEPATVSACAVPLLVQGRPLGALRFSFSEPRLFDEDERRFVLTLASQTAQALDRAQLQQSRLEVSTRLQKSLLPRLLPAIPGVEAAAVYHPFGEGIEVGGDFYDLWPTVDDAFCFVIGDVVGTGPEAAGVAALVRYSLRALTLEGGEVTTTLRRLNDVVFSAMDDSTGGEVFCTAVLGTVMPRRDGVEVVLAGGGHPFPLIRRTDGHIDEVTLGGSLLGAIPTIETSAVRLELVPGEMLALYTDGLMEARSRKGEFFGEDGISRVLAEPHPSAASAVSALEGAVLAHVGGQLDDDLAALVLRVTGAADS
jgi:serine phosphatase RsbU (regulator of sigma subunit)/anti-sigma regulatory factor (Ser/Thr protein kinase)